MQNILAFRFANGMFEPLWNKQHIDHIQFTVSESVSVEGRGGYYDRSGVLRDMIQNHMFQMLAYVCMEPPSSFAADDIRNEKAKLLKAVRVFTPRGGAARTRSAASTARARRPTAPTAPPTARKPDVNPQSNTETFAAAQALHRQLALGGRARFTCVRARPCGSAAPRSWCSSRSRRR